MAARLNSILLKMKNVKWNSLLCARLLSKRTPCQQSEFMFMWPMLKNLSLAKQGQYYRGFHVPPEDMHLLPDYLSRCVFRPDEELMLEEKSLSFCEMLAVDHLVYIRN